MGRTREELLATITAKELIEWHILSSIEPFGEKRADLRAGSIVQAIISQWITKGKKKPTLNECTLNFGPKKPMHWKTIKRNIGNKLPRGEINGGN